MMYSALGLIYLGLGLDYLELYPPLITKVYIHERIPVAGIIYWTDGGSRQDSLFLCQNLLVKGITTIIYRSNTLDMLLLSSGKLLIGIIISNKFIEFVYHGIYDTRGSEKFNLIRRATTMVMLIQEVRYTNPKKNIVQPYIFMSVGTFQNSVCAILIDPDAVFRRVLLPIIRFSTSY